MTVDQVLEDVRRYHAIIVSPTELYGEVPPRTRYHFKRHAGHLAQRIQQSEVSVCPSRDLHRRYYKYIGGGLFVCEACARLTPYAS